MRINQTFHESLCGAYAAELADAYDDMEDATLSTKERHRAAIRASIWHNLFVLETETLRQIRKV